MSILIALRQTPPDTDTDYTRINIKIMGTPDQYTLKTSSLSANTPDELLRLLTNRKIKRSWYKIKRSSDGKNLSEIRPKCIRNSTSLVMTSIREISEQIWQVESIPSCSFAVIVRIDATESEIAQLKETNELLRSPYVNLVMQSYVPIFWTDFYV